MKLTPFLLDQWLDEHADLPIEFQLASSTGPRWKFRELLALDGEGALDRLQNLDVVYSRSAGDSRLREAIAEMHGVAAEDVVVLIGAAEGLYHLFFLAAEPGANVIVPFPCFPSFEAMPQSLGLEVRPYHLRRENSYQVDFDEVKRLADGKTKLLLVNSPHNPTGATLSDAEMSALHDFAAAREIQFVADEVYHPIYHGRTTSSAARLPHATVLGDFSKALSLSGLRLGWLIERDADRREHYLTAREYISVSNPPMMEFCAEIAVRHRERIYARARQVTSANLRVLDGFLSEFSGVLDWVRPQGGTTCFPRLISGAESRAFCQAAARQGVLLAPGDCFGVPDHFRLGYALSQESFPRAMERFAEFLYAWAHAPRASMTA